MAVSASNLEIVSRNGSVSSNIVVKQTNEIIVQINDHFHLVKELVDSAMKYIALMIAANMRIPMSAIMKMLEQQIIGIKNKNRIFR